MRSTTRRNHWIVKAGIRAGWGVGDQTLSSLTNFVLGIVIARSVDQISFGAFGIAFATYIVALGISRTLTSEPFSVRYSAVDHDTWAAGAASATGSALLLGALGGLVCAGVGLVLHGELRSALFALGLSLPGLLLQDAWRFLFFAAGKGHLAFLNDLVWALVLLPAMAAVVLLDSHSVATFVAVWGLAATSGAIAGILQSRILPRVSRAFEWWRENKKLGPRFLAEFVAYQGAEQLAMYGVAALLGLPAIASIRAAEIILGPVNLLIMGMRLVAVPQGVEALRTSRRDLGRIIVLYCSLGALAAAGWGAIAFLLPTEVGESLLGDTWRGAHRVILIVALARSASAIVAGASAGLRSLGAAKRSLNVRLACAPIIVASTLVGSVWGVTGAVTGAATGQVVAASIWLRHFTWELAGAPELPST